MARLVLLGGGHSHIEVLLQAPTLGMPAEIVLVEPHAALPYTGMVPGFIAGFYGLDDILIDLTALCARAGVALKRARATAIDAQRKTVTCDDGTSVAYDLLSIDIGSILDLAVSGAAAHALAVRPLWRFVETWPEVVRRASSVAVVGAGAAGIELALAVHRALVTRGITPSVAVIGDAPQIAAGLSERARMHLEGACSRRGIRLHLGTRVAEVTGDAVVMDDGAAFSVDAVMWSTGPVAPSWLRGTGLELDERGFLSIDGELRVGGRPDIYAAGDVASMQAHPRPKSGVYAVRAAPLLARNLKRALLGQQPETYVPQRRALALIGTGDRRAVAAYGALGAEGFWVWRWKDRIDRRFVQRYRV
jgi:selenide,water dikinase